MTGARLIMMQREGLLQVRLRSKGLVDNLFSPLWYFGEYRRMVSRGRTYFDHFSGAWTLPTVKIQATCIVILAMETRDKPTPIFVEGISLVSMIQQLQD